MQFMTILSYGCSSLQIGCKIVSVSYGRSELVLIQIVSEVAEVAGLQ